MTENKRFMLDDTGELIDKETAQFIEYGEKVCDLLNEQHEEIMQLKQKIGNLEHTRDFCADVCADCERLEEENEQLKQFPVKLENRIQKLQEDLQKLTEMDKSDLNPQAIEDVATVIGISLNALIEFQKELME